jgi:Ca-activated chloride channel family protein
VVPLEVNTRSYDLSRQWIERGERPPPRQLHTEELLAAIDYSFPPPKRGPVALHVAGGPSPLAFGRGRLLQVGLRARDVPAGDRPSTHLIFAVDASSSMGEGGRLGLVRRALSDLGGSLDADDRASLVVFRERAQSMAEQIGPDAWGQFVAAVDSLDPSGSTNVAAGLRQAYVVAHHRFRDGDGARRVVLLTDSLGPLDAVTAERIHARLVEAAGRGIVLHVIGLGPTTWEEEPTGILARLASAAGGRAHQTSDSEGIGRALREVLSGKPQLVASGLRLEVTFNPKSVAAYRLLGHEIGDVPAELEADFYAGQSATALYEVQLRPNRGKLVAEVEATWRDPATGRPASITRRFRRGQFAGSLVDAPLSIQAATVVAEAAEILRGSPFVGPRPNPRSLAPVLHRARQLDTRVRDEPTFAEFVSLLERAEAARPHRSGG